MSNKDLTIVGLNAAGVTSKIDSFDKVLFDVMPSVWMMQETKRKQYSPQLTSQNLNNYQIFELKREKSKLDGGKGLSGGGLAIGVLHDLKPVLVRQGDDDSECLSLQVTVSTQNILCVTGYGPQIGDIQS